MPGFANGKESKIESCFATPLAAAYLSVLVPDLLEITREDGRKLIRVKNNPGRIKTIRNALEGIRKTPSEDRLLAAVKRTQAKVKRGRKETGPLPEKGRKTLDEFLE